MNPSLSLAVWALHFPIPPASATLPTSPHRGPQTWAQQTAPHPEGSAAIPAAFAPACLPFSGSYSSNLLDSSGSQWRLPPLAPVTLPICSVHLDKLRTSVTSISRNAHAGQPAWIINSYASRTTASISFFFLVAHNQCSLNLRLKTASSVKPSWVALSADKLPCLWPHMALGSHLGWSSG